VSQAADSAAGPAVGIVANPLAGKDIRRLTSGATPISDAVKIGAIRRAVVGAIEGGAELHRAAWKAGIVDRVRLYLCPVTLGRGGVPWMPDARFSLAALGPVRTRCLGADVLLEADVQRFD